jgi:DNA-binding LacI/PurR family transcriptional regulator
MRDIANELGVAHQSVSMVLRNKGTSERILARCREVALEILAEEAGKEGAAA